MTESCKRLFNNLSDMVKTLNGGFVIQAPKGMVGPIRLYALLSFFRNY